MERRSGRGRRGAGTSWRLGRRLGALAVIGAAVGGVLATAQPGAAQTTSAVTILAGPADPTPTTLTRPWFKFSVTPFGTRTECAVDTGAFAACTGSYFMTPVLAPGAHTVRIRPVGNPAGEATRTFTRNPAAPNDPPAIAYPGTEAGFGGDQAFSVNADRQGRIYASIIASSSFSTSALFRLNEDGSRTQIFRAALGQVAFDSQGTIYMASRTAAIYKLSAANVFSFINTTESDVYGVAVDSADNLYISPANTGRILKVARGTTTPVPFATLPGTTNEQLAFDSHDNLFVSGGNRVYKVTPAGVATVFAGSNTATTPGNGGPAIDALIALDGITVDADDNVYTVGQNMRKITAATGIITQIGGSGPFACDGRPVSQISLGGHHLAADKAGNVYVNEGDKICKIEGLINTAPKAGPDSLTVAADDPAGAAVNVASNDVDPEGDALSFAIDTQGSLGTATCTTVGMCTYVPNGTGGADSFTYVVRDTAGHATIGTVSVTVTPPNLPPVANADSLTVAEDDPDGDVVNVATNDSDPEGAALTYALATPAAKGTASCTSVGMCTYVPNADVNGTDSFTYTVTDPKGKHVDATVSVTITPVNDAPTATPIAPLSGNEGAPIAVSVAANDIDGDPLSVAWTSTSPLCTFASPTAASTTVTCTDNGTFPITAAVSDGTAAPVAVTTSATVGNVAPVVTFTAPATGFSVPTGQTVAVSASFTDAGTADTHTCQIAWGDATTSAGAVAAGVCTGSHTYAATASGARTIDVTVTDDDLAAATASRPITVTAVVVTTGCTKVTSDDGDHEEGDDEGDHEGDDPGDDHHATAAAPTPGPACRVQGQGSLGTTTFELEAHSTPKHDVGELDLRGSGWRFRSEDVRTLVVTSTPDRSARWSGTGTLDNKRGYTYEITVNDKRAKGTTTGAPDTLRIVIKDARGVVVRTVDAVVTKGDLRVG